MDLLMQPCSPFRQYVGKGLPVQVFHHKTAVQLLDGPGRWEVALRHSLVEHARHPSAPVIGYAPDLVTNSAGTLLIPVPISPPKMGGIEQFVRWGAARLGGSCHAWGDARPDRALACGDCDARFARARYSYQSRAVRALRLVAHPANELPVRLTG